MKQQIFNNRYVWVYLHWDYEKSEGKLSMWVSPDRNAKTLSTIDTPYHYQLTRENIRYYVSSEVQLSQRKAIEIAGMMYESEFELAPRFKQKIAKGR